MTTAAAIQVTESATAADGLSIWPLYESVFGDYPTFEAWREAVWDKHRTRGGFRLARAYDAGALVGFAYGYTGQAGQWWTDNVHKTLPPEVADAWLGGHFEVVSLGVARTARRAGFGRRLLHALVDDLGHDRLLLMTTDDGADPARRLYASDGWQVIGPGIGDATVVMGKRNP
jgi:ribosomal protein S18 acetylase RimI-like enzyme